MGSISVVIPIHDPDGSQQNRVLRMAHSLASQDHQIAQVMMTANHDLKYLKEVSRILAPVNRFEFHVEKSINAPQNLNLGMALATEPIVKILFQDDFLMGVDHLSKLASRFSQRSSSWVVSRSLNFAEKSARIVSDIRPRYGESLRNGVNRIGAPSVVAMRKTAILPFSEDLIYMFDCEWYLKMAHSFGPPVVADDLAVAIGLHDDQLTHSAAYLLSRERAITRLRHPRIGPFRSSCPCTLS